MKYMLSSICFVFLYYILVSSANDSLSKHNDLNVRTYLTPNSDFLVHSNNSRILNSNNLFYEYKKWQFDSFLSANQRKCLNDVLYILKNMNSDWAVKMLDSYGKIPSGVLLGNLLWIGKYNECVRVKASKSGNGTSGFQGMYCLAQWNISLPSKIHLPMLEVPIKTGICLPDSCFSIDVKSSISHIIDLLYILPVIKQYEGDLKLASVECRPTETHLSLASILFLSFLVVYFLLPVTGTFLTISEYFSKCSKTTTPLENSLIINCETIIDNESVVHLEREECEDDQYDLTENHYALEEMKSTQKLKKNILEKASKSLKCFCFFSNTMQLFNTNSAKKQFSCLHGLRFLSMAWVILGHTYVHNTDYIIYPVMSASSWIPYIQVAISGSILVAQDNYMELLKGIDNLPFQAVMQGTFSVDTFFLIGGFLLGYLYLEEADKRNGRINWLGLCLHRFLRITPVYLFLIGFATLIFKYLDTGPFWKTPSDVTTCKQYWWWNILYMNNFLPFNSMCLTWTWYLANDMQFFVISSLILYVLWRWKYLGVSLFCTILVLSWSITWYLSSVYNISPMFWKIAEVKNYTEYQENLIVAWDVLYSKPYCRIGPHILGILLACFMYYNKGRSIIMSKRLQIFGWCLSIFCSASVIYGLYHINLNSTFLNMYNAFARTSFSLGVAWVIFCCLTGNAGFINDFLSLKVWIPFSRLTYCAYLFHPLIMNWYFQSRETPLYFTHSIMVVLYFSFLLMSYGIAFLISIIFETPLLNLEKLVYKR